MTGEVTDGVLELRTPVCDDAGEAVGVLGALRAELSEVTPLLGAGVHPLGAYGDVHLRGGERYELIDRSLRSLMRQTPHCGVHVHVGMPDGETAIRAANGMRGWIPLLQALGANSPYLYGRDSGLASARSVICNSLPRSGMPRALDGYADYVATVEELRALGEFPDDSYLWWDLRPHPRFGTLEIRALDAQSSLEDLVALVSLVHCLAVHEASSPPRRLPGPRGAARAELPRHARRARRAAAARRRAAARAGSGAARRRDRERLRRRPRLLGGADARPPALERGNGAARQRAKRSRAASS